MISMLAASSFLTLIENNLPLFAAGHLGLVLILLIVFFNLSSNANPKEPKEKDEDAFDYGTEDGSMFKSNTEGSLALEKIKSQETEEAEDNSDEPIVFNSQIDDSKIPDGTDDTEQEEKEGDEVTETEPETIAVTELSAEEKKLNRIEEILKSLDSKPVIAINRDETILDLNALASERFQYTKEDIEGKKIEDIIFLESAKEGEAESDGQQKAKAECKDGTQFSTMVELEMADREFGIITVTLFADAVAEPEPEPEPEPEEKEELTLAKEEPEPAPEPVVPAVKKPLPPPPRPKVQPGTLSLQTPGGAISNRAMDTKTVGMFSDQLSQPLQSIAQMAQLIASDENAVPHLKKYAVAIQAKTNRMMSEIEEMSQLASAQTGELSVSDTPFNLGNMISDLVKMVSEGSAQDGKEDTTKIGFQRGDQDLIVMSDKDHFEKVLSNIINVTLTSVDNQEIELLVTSDVVKEKEAGETINFNGSDIQINTVRKLSIVSQFPGDEHINRFFDVSINRADNPLVQRLQSSNALQNHTTSIRLIKELAHRLGGKLTFSSDENQIGKIMLTADLPCAEVAAYPA